MKIPFFWKDKSKYVDVNEEKIRVVKPNRLLTIGIMWLALGGSILISKYMAKV
jgi:hypothetical protein